MDSKKAGKIAKALADPNRILILKEIRRQKKDLYCIAINDLVDLAQPSICHHLKILTDTELIHSSKEGRNVKYSLNQEVLDEYIGFLTGLKK